MRWTWAQAAFQFGPDVLDPERREVPLRQDDDRRALRLARNVGDGEVLFDQALRRVDQNQGDAGTLGRVDPTELRVVLDPLAGSPLPTQAGGTDAPERPPAPL